VLSARGGHVVTSDSHAQAQRRLPGQRSEELVDVWTYGWMPHNAGFGFLDIAGPTLGQIHF
jgi:hypothetical protein